MFSAGRCPDVSISFLLCGRVLYKFSRIQDRYLPACMATADKYLPDPYPYQGLLSRCPPELQLPIFVNMILYLLYHPYLILSDSSISFHKKPGRAQGRRKLRKRVRKSILKNSTKNTAKLRYKGGRVVSSAIYYIIGCQYSMKVLIKNIYSGILVPVNIFGGSHERK